MKKKYTKKQITEAIAYWEKQLKMMNESAKNAVAIPTMDESSQMAFEKQLNELFGGDVYESLFDLDREDHTIDGLKYAVSQQDLVSRDYFWDFIYARLNEDFDPGQEVAADKMKKLVEGWAKEMYQTCLENFKNDPDPDYLTQDDDGPNPDDWDLYARDRWGY